MLKVLVCAASAKNEGSFRPLTRMANTSSFSKAGGMKLFRVALSIRKKYWLSKNWRISSSLLSTAATCAVSATKVVSTTTAVSISAVKMVLL